MPEVQTSTQSGEMSQRFIEFILMQAQNAALFLGQVPHPQTGQAEINLDLAKMFVDQLEMIQEKTRGNLTNEEASVLRGTLSNLQLAYVQAAQEQKGVDSPSTAQPASTPSPMEEQFAAESRADDASAPAGGETESRKKFTKSYGA